MRPPSTCGRRNGARAPFAVGVATWASLLGACGDAAPGATVVDAGAAPTCSLPGIADPTFATTTAWAPFGGAALTPGAVVFDTSTMCTHGGVAQPFPASRAACARPLVMTVDLTLEDEDTIAFMAGLGAGWNTSAISLGAQTLRICLGARAFEDASTLVLGMGNNPWVCPPPSFGGPSISVTRASIADDVMGVCPLPGTVTNGDFERGPTGWTVKKGGGTAELAAGLGEGGSFAAHLATDLECETPSVAGTLSLPTSAMLPNPALRVWSRGTNGVGASARIGSLVQKFGTGSATLFGTGAPVATNVCLPRWAQGTVQPLSFSFIETRLTQECATASARDFVFDGLAFVSEPACAADVNVFDPGFEQAVTAPALAPSWTLQRFDDEPGARVALATDGSWVHGGRAAAVFTASTPCSHANLAAGVAVPACDGAGGPALKFWYDTRATARTSLAVTMNALLAPVPLPAVSAWTQVTACLDPRLAGRPDLLTFALVSDGGGLCADTFAMESAAVDDVELTTDPSCAVASP
jgi:hypothetical protein